MILLGGHGRRGCPRRPWDAYRPNYLTLIACPLRPQILLRVPGTEKISVSTLVWVSVIRRVLPPPPIWPWRWIPVIVNVWPVEGPARYLLVVAGMGDRKSPYLGHPPWTHRRDLSQTHPGEAALVDDDCACSACRLLGWQQALLNGRGLNPHTVAFAWSLPSPRLLLAPLLLGFCLPGIRFLPRNVNVPDRCGVIRDNPRLYHRSFSRGTCSHGDYLIFVS